MTVQKTRPTNQTGAKVSVAQPPLLLPQPQSPSQQHLPPQPKLAYQLSGKLHS